VEKASKNFEGTFELFRMTLSNLRTKFKRTCEGSFEELGKSFE
jgi:hypothetical protein